MHPSRLVIFDGRMPHSHHIQPDQFRDFYRINQIFISKATIDPGASAGPSSVLRKFTPVLSSLLPTDFVVVAFGLRSVLTFG